VLDIINKVINNEFSNVVLKFLYDNAAEGSILKNTILIHDNINNFEKKNNMENKVVTEGSWWQFKIDSEMSCEKECF